MSCRHRLIGTNDHAGPEELTEKISDLEVVQMPWEEVDVEKSGLIRLDQTQHLELNGGCCVFFSNSMFD